MGLRAGLYASLLANAHQAGRTPILLRDSHPSRASAVSGISPGGTRQSLAPLLWCRLIACVCVLTQSLPQLDQASLRCSVDDPLAALAGTVEDIKIMATMMILTWEALGVKQAYAKAGNLAKR